MAQFAAQPLQGSRRSLNGGGLQGTLSLRSSGSEGRAHVLPEVIQAQGGPPFLPDVDSKSMHSSALRLQNIISESALGGAQPAQEFYEQFACPFKKVAQTFFHVIKNFFRDSKLGRAS